MQRVRALGQQQSRASGPWYTIFLVFVVSSCLLAVVGSFVGDGGVTVLRQQSTLKDELRRKIDREERRRSALLERATLVRHDAFTLERVAREELGLVREGEIVFDFRQRGAPQPPLIH